MGKHGKLMKTIKGPAVFLAQFVDKKAPFNSIGLCNFTSKHFPRPMKSHTFIILEQFPTLLSPKIPKCIEIIIFVTYSKSEFEWI